MPYTEHLLTYLNQLVVYKIKLCITGQQPKVGSITYDNKAKAIEVARNLALSKGKAGVRCYTMIIAV